LASSEEKEKQRFTNRIRAYWTILQFSSEIIFRRREENPNSSKRFLLLSYLQWI
jgi:hypothetical protein